MGSTPREEVPASASPSASYCCYGCRFAHAVVQERGTEGAIRWTVIRLGLAIFFTMNLMAFTMTMWSLDVYDVEPDPFQLTLFEVFRWLSMVLALPVLLLLGIPLLQNAIESRGRQGYSTDLLIGLAVVAAYLTSVVNVVRDAGTTWFEVGAMVLVMMTLGRWIEAAGKHKATEALDRLMTLLPDVVTRVRRNAAEAETTTAPTTAPTAVPTAAESDAAEEWAGDTTGDREGEIPSTAVAVGDVLRIRAGDRFPTDAAVLRGRTTVDEQVFSGESVPIARTVGDPVLAGTVNLDGDILVRVTAPFRQGSFGRLLSVLQEARSARGSWQRLADRVASWFFPAVTLIAAGAFGWHLSSGVGVAIQTALSVLLIACPCALGLATPLAIWTSLSTAVRRQVLFRSGEAVERLAGAKAICLDKTGTVTTGQPSVSQAAALGDADVRHALSLAARLADASAHPFSRAVHAYADQRRRDAADQSADTDGTWQDVGMLSIRTVSGGGVEATTTDGRVVRLGSLEFACCDRHRAMGTFHTRQGSLAATHDAGDGGCCRLIGPRDVPLLTDPDMARPPDMCVSCGAAVPLNIRVQLDRLRMAADRQATSIVLLTIDGIPTFGFLISEMVRKEAAETIRNLSAAVDVVCVLSGDRPARGRALSDQLKVPGLKVECNLSPERKVIRVAEIRRQSGCTVMVGDGINDAPALAASDVGIAMGCGADVARDSAQICLLGNDLSRIPWALQLARRTRTVIRQNLFWAFAYNTGGVTLAAVGWLNPAIAAGLMIASSLLVISNSLRLLGDSGLPDEGFGGSAPSTDTGAEKGQAAKNQSLDATAGASRLSPGEETDEIASSSADRPVPTVGVSP
ncbi:MAG: cation-translocating P-type ATPase [Fuerstiella sp.]